MHHTHVQACRCAHIYTHANHVRYPQALGAITDSCHPRKDLVIADECQEAVHSHLVFFALLACLEQLLLVFIFGLIPFAVVCVA